MKTLLLSAMALGLTAAVTLSPAQAEGPKPSDNNTWPGISQRVDHGVAIAALPAFGTPEASDSGVEHGVLGVPADSNAAATAPKYQWQYHFAGMQNRWEGHWIIVGPPHAHLTQVDERYPGPAISSSRR